MINQLKIIASRARLPRLSAGGSKNAWGGILLMLFLLPGCASGLNVNPRDPLEPLNRKVYQFNDAVDTALVKPVAIAYQDFAPAPLRRGISNIFGNLQDAWSFANNAMQLKGRAAADSLARFGVNTFMGLGGLLDVATAMNIERHPKDFGHTLGFWGVVPGPYLVLPLFGPSTVRDTAALAVDLHGDIAASITHVPTRNTVTAVRAIDTRESLLNATAMLDEAALDKYSFTRDSYLQLRRSALFDGNPPDDETPETSPQQNQEVKP